MRTLLLSLLLVGCGGSDNNNTPIDAPAPTPDAPAVALTCTNYCSTITTSCTGALAQFGGSSAADATAHCMGTCAAFSTSATQSGDTIGCHLYHATVAGMAGNAATHCPHAGPAGDVVGTGSTAGGVCGDACTNFCTLVQATCTGANAAYADMTTCMNACAGFSTATAYTVNTTTFPSVNPTGNTLACRLYHATNAAVSAAQAAIHCAHTKATSAVCM